MRRILMLLATMSFAVLMASGVALAVTTTFTHHRPTVIASDDRLETSTIQVSGFPEGSTIQDVNVKLTRFSSSYPGLLRILLFHDATGLGPNAEVMANDGGCFGNEVSRINLVLDQQASTGLPSPGGPLTSGTFHPTLDSAFPAPLSVFNGQDPNGAWTISIENFSGDSVKIGAWSVQITT